MNKSRKLAAQMATAIAIATLFGTSAFAEERHLDRTDDATQAQQTDHRDRQWRDRNRDTQPPQQTDRRDQRQADQNWNRNNRGEQQQYDRGRTNENNNYDRRRNDNQQYDRGRTNNQQYDRGRSNQSYNRGRSNDGYRYDTHGYRYDNRGWGDRYDNRGRRSFLGEGRVTRYVHERGGYRVWIDGGYYPFFVPEARWRAFPLRVGLSIRLGGWYDPLGYVDVYDVGPYAWDGGAYATSGDLRGVVESVDYRRGTVVVRDDISGSFVTAVMRGARMGDLRPGDYVDFGGDWSRAGVFNAYQLYDVR